jgi:enamine deaminase RidA (YjgF/YER057c/UK114 family)
MMVGRVAIEQNPDRPAGSLPGLAKRKANRIFPGGSLMARQFVSTGTPWEKRVAYSRAVRVGPHVFVSGTTASESDGATIAPGNAYEQTVSILRKIEAALASAGAKRSDVVRTRMFVTDIDRWEEIGRAHQEFFAGINPAATMVEVQRLINPDHLVEIEVDALVE